MPSLCFFFFNDTATTEIYTLSLHDALPIATDHRHRLGTVGLLAAELSGGGHGPQAEHGEYSDDDDSAALHLRAAPSWRIGWDALTRQYVAGRRLFPAWTRHLA